MSSSLNKPIPIFARYLFLAVPFIFYWYTCAPAIGMSDTAMLIDEIKKLQIWTNVNNHNTTIILGWLFSFLPFEDFSYKGNLVSVVFGAFTVSLFYICIYRAFKSIIVAAISATFFMLSNSMWWHSTIVECYCINALFTVASLYLYVRMHERYSDKYLYILFSLGGLSMFNHVQMGFLCAAAACCLIWRMIHEKGKAAKLFFYSTVSFLIGFLPWLITFLRDWHRSPSFSAALSGAFFGRFQSIVIAGSWWDGFIEVLFLIFNQTPNLYLAAVPIGVFLVIRQWKFSTPTIGLSVHFLLNTGFFLTYNTWDRFAFLLPSFIILIFCGSFAVARAVYFCKAKKQDRLWAAFVLATFASFAFSIYFYENLSVWGSNPDSIWHKRYDNEPVENTHNAIVYYTNPNKRNFTDIHDYITLLFEKLPPNSFYFDDDSRNFYSVELYQRLYKLRPDLRLFVLNSWGFNNWGCTKKGFANIFKKSYYTDQQLFLISLKYPFNYYLFATPDYKKYKFIKYPLDDKHWIYKLVTVSEVKKQDNHQLTDLPILNIGETPKTFNIEKSLVMFTYKAHILNQQTDRFGPGWENGDHLLIRPKRFGAEVEFTLKAETDLLADILIRFTTAKTYGVVKILLDGILIKNPIDLFNSTKVSTKSVLCPDIRLKKGFHRLVMRVSKKNPASKGKSFGIDTLTINPKPLTAKDRSVGRKYIPHNAYMRVGQYLNTRSPQFKDSFLDTERVMVILGFDPAQERLPLHFTWIDPTGARYYSNRPFMLNKTNIGLWTSLKKSWPQRTPGVWRVEAYTGEKLIKSINFKIIQE